MITKRKLIALLAAAASLLLASVLVVGAAAAPDPLKGTWYSIDTDTSNQTMHVGGGPGNSYHVRYFDDGASVCGWTPTGGGDGATAQGTLTGAGNVLQGELPVYCLASPPVFYADATFYFTYDPGTNTLLDSHGVTWHR